MAYEGFDKLAAKVGPAVAASIGRKKYGKKKFQNAAAKGKKLKGAKPAKKSGGDTKEWLDKHAR